MYLRAFIGFYDWCVISAWADRVTDVPSLEAALVEWLEAKHEEGVGPYVGNCVFGAIRMLSRRTFNELVEGRALLADWNGMRTALHWPPLPFPLVLVLAEEQFLRGQPEVALAFLLAFAGLLRISEVAGLRGQDVVFPEDPRLFGISFVVLALEHTKTGDDLSSEVRAQWVWPLLRSWVRVRLPRGTGTRLFPSAAKLRSHLAQSLAALGISHVGFVFHSLRAGGALHLLNCQTPLEEVLRRGRWRKPESARPYLQRLRALAAGNALPYNLMQRGSRLASDPGRLVSRWPV